MYAMLVHQRAARYKPNVITCFSAVPNVYAVFNPQTCLHSHPAPQTCS